MEQLKQQAAKLDADARSIVEHLRRQDEDQARYGRQRRERFYIGLACAAAALVILLATVLINGYVTRREIRDQDTALCPALISLQKEYDRATPAERAALPDFRRKFYEEDLPYAIRQKGCAE